MEKAANQNAEKSQNRLLHLIRRSLVIFIALLLIIYFVSVLIGSSDFFIESAEKNALLYFDEDIARAEALAEQHYANLYEVVARLEFSSGKDEVEEIVSSYIGSDEFGDLRYYSQGVAYAANGVVVSEENSAGQYIDQLLESGNRGCTPVYYDAALKLDCIAFYVPIRGSAYVDGILSIIPARNVIRVGSVINESASAVAVISGDGKVLSDTRKESFNRPIGNNFYTFINALTNDKADSDKMADAVALGQKTAFTVAAGGLQYTIAVSPLSNFDGSISLVCVSESNGLVAPEMAYIRHIVNLLIIATVALIIGFIYAILYQKRSKRELANAVLFDTKLDCPNAEQFKIQSKDILLTRVKYKYSLLLISIRNFFYFQEQLGEDQCTEVLKAFVKVFEGLSSADECYGYAGDGKFLMLMIHANHHSVNDKIKLAETLCNRTDILKEKGIKIKFAAGVYNVFSGRKRSVQEMMDCANTACGYAESDIKMTYTVFTEAVKAQIEHNERIEAMMESALANREFRLFLQPKYSVKNDSIDSAEALVRWFDTSKGEYMFPGEFIPLFESNGFIVKLDHFVYIEVLEYLSHAAERGERVVPIAVNVSRVTATSPDFINFYVGNKNKYRIPDGFVTLELTESFAMEDYEKIYEIITALHNGGLRCSIDDFGSGYSSFSILKQITVDELKLDSVFVKRGINIQRDEKLLATIIDLGKSMGMSVVQEGVETKEIFDKVIAMGCDVIQGYYYAKAIPLEEFKIFVNTNTSIKYKALVK